MKRTGLISILLGLGIINTYPQDSIVSIPDTAFLNALISEGVDNNGDSLISYAEAKNITSLNVSKYGISDMTGIKAFTNLRNLQCIGNNLTQLDLTNNTVLRMLECDHNSLSHLDVSENSVLQDLYCGHNQLFHLDLTNNTALNSLACWNNQLSDLDISSNIALHRIYCHNNHIDSLDVSKNLSLNRLLCSNNQLSNLKVFNNPDLDVLECGNNRLTNLDISGSSTLRWLDCNSNILINLNVTNASTLSKLDCSSNQLTSLDVSNNIDLGSLRCGGNQLSTLDISNIRGNFSGGCCGTLGEFIAYYGLQDSSHFDISNMPSLYKVCTNDTFVFHIISDTNNKHYKDDTTVFVTMHGSPNVRFTSDCSLDFTPPRIEALDTLYQPDYLEATSSEDGMIYLVAEETEKVIGVIHQECIDSVSAIANTPVSISLSGLENRTYWLYATDSSGNISEPEAFSIMGVGIERGKAEDIKIYPNPTNSLLTIATVTSDHCSIDVTSLNGQLIYNHAMEGITHQLDLSSFQKGVYVITIRSKDFVTTRKILKL